MIDYTEIQMFVSQLPPTRKVEFYLRFSHALTAIARLTQLQNKMALPEQLEVIKWINELQHRVVSHLLSLHTSEAEISDQDLLSLAYNLGSEVRFVKEHIDWAIRSSFEGMS